MNNYEINKLRIKPNVLACLSGSVDAFSFGDTPFPRTWWLLLYKSSEWTEFTTTKPYFFLISSEHSIGGSQDGIYWGECDDTRFTNYVFRDFVVQGFQSETGWLMRVPSAESGIADEIFFYYHTDGSDPSNNGIQQTNLLTTSGGSDLSNVVWTNRGKTFGRENGEIHTGYGRIFRRGSNDYVAFHLATSTLNPPAYARISYSSDAINWRRRNDIYRSKNLPANVVTGTTGFYYFEEGGLPFCLGFYFNTVTQDRGVALYRVDEEYRPKEFLTLLINEVGFTDFDAYFEGNEITITYRSGATSLELETYKTRVYQKSCLTPFLTPYVVFENYKINLDIAFNESITLDTPILLPDDFSVVFHGVNFSAESAGFAPVFSGTTTTDGRLIISQTNAKGIINIGSSTVIEFNYAFALNTDYRIRLSRINNQLGITINSDAIIPLGFNSNTLQIARVGSGATTRRFTGKINKFEFGNPTDGVTEFLLDEQTGSTITATNGATATINSTGDQTHINTNVWTGTDPT